MFITFEGIEGGGKTTQIQKLAEHLKSKGIEVVLTKEPGGTPIGSELRRMILDPNSKFQSPYTEILLFFADRLEHVETVVKPALAAKKWVLCDRYIDSTYAYQIGGRGMPEDLIQNLTQMINLIPNQTLLFDLSPEEGIARAKKRSALDRFEQESIDFHQRIREAYLKRAEQFPERISVLSVGGKDPDTVFHEIQALIRI